jgi:hypothetical protein
VQNHGAAVYDMPRTSKLFVNKGNGLTGGDKAV